MTPTEESGRYGTDEPAGEPASSGLTRTDLIRKAAVIGAAAVAAPVYASTAAARVRTAATARAGKGKVILSSFQDGGLTAFKEKIIPLFQRETGIKIEYVEDAYTSTFEKQFNDGIQKAGQFDIYVMDDPWIPQFAAGQVLQNLSKLGFKPDSDYMKPFVDLNYWPPLTGPRLPAFKKVTPQLYAMPFVGDMQSLTYRKDILGHPPATWTELLQDAKTKAHPPQTYGFVMRGVKGSPILTSWFPVFYSLGGKMFDDNWKVIFNNAVGKKATEFFVHTLKGLCPPGVVEYNTNEEGAAILGGKALAIIQYSGNALLSNNPKSTKLVGKLAFGKVPSGPGGSIAQIGIWSSGISVSAPNQENAVTFQKWFVTKKTQLALARAGSLPIRRSAFTDPVASRKNPLQKTILAQLDAGALPRPRMPDWTAIENILGIEMNKALQAGTIGNHLDTAAAQVTAFLKKNGYYK